MISFCNGLSGKTSKPMPMSEVDAMRKRLRAETQQTLASRTR